MNEEKSAMLCRKISKIRKLTLSTNFGSLPFFRCAYGVVFCSSAVRCKLKQTTENVKQIIQAIQQVTDMQIICCTTTSLMMLLLNSNY